MQLRELRSLVELARTGSITLTAENLHLTPAAIHKQLQGMQKELGVPLYQRTGRMLELTKAAEVMLPHLGNLLAQYDAALSALEDWKDVKQGAVRIGTGPTLSTYVLPQLLKPYRRRFPGIELQIETGNSRTLVDAVVRGSFDLALLVSSDLPEPPNLVIEASWPIEMVLLSRSGHAPAHARLSDLRKFPFILYKAGSRLGNLVDRYFAEMDFQPRVPMRFDNAEAIKAMIRIGLGISMLPVWAVDGDLKKGTFSIIRQRERPLMSRIELVSRKAGYVPKSVQAFAELARATDIRHPRLTAHAVA
jgi:DNA-binding transcriptional LysR family regulator